MRSDDAEGAARIRGGDDTAQQKFLDMHDLILLMLIVV